MNKPDFECVICGTAVSIRYYFCHKHVEYVKSELPWVRFLVNNAAASRMRWLSRMKSKTKITNFSDLGTTDQKNLGLDPEREY